MKRHFFYFLMCGILISTFTSCDTVSDSSTQIIRGRYAKLFSYSHHQDRTYINVYLPQDTISPYKTYLLYKGEGSLPVSEGDTTVLRVPLKNIGCAHSTQIGFVDALGATELIKSIGDKKLLEKKSVLRGRDDLGEFFDGWTFDVERLLTLRPEGVFFSPYGTEDIPSLEKSTRTPILLDMSPWESHPLARSEWLRFVSFFIGKEHEADSLFLSIEEKYLRVKAEAAASTTRPVVLAALPYEGIWYIPAGGSYKGIMFADAAMQYPWSDHGESGSLTVDFERMLSIGTTADVWFIESGLDSAPTKASMLAQNPLYVHFKPFSTGRVFVCDTNDVLYFEKGILEPHLILEDYVHLSRGDKDYIPHYYQVISDEEQ